MRILPRGFVAGEREKPIGGFFGDGDMFAGTANINVKTGCVRVGLSSSEGVLPRLYALQFHVSTPPEPVAVYQGVKTAITNNSQGTLYNSLGESVGASVASQFFPRATLPQPKR